MKKLEKMDGKLFESLKPNEMSNLGALVGGWYDQATENGKDVYRVYETFANTWVNGAPSQDNLREDSRSAIHWYESVTFAADPLVEFDGAEYWEVNQEG